VITIIHTNPPVYLSLKRLIRFYFGELLMPNVES
jgi:hypothetical protein